MIVQVGLCHRTAPATLLEQLQAAHGSHSITYDDASHMHFVAVATCHRLELYTEGVPEEVAVAVWRRWARVPTTQELPSGLAVRGGPAAGRHLLRVAAGLESAVLGEDQVLAQLRGAYRAACVAGTAGPFLHRLFHAAFRAGRRVRGETALASGSRSLSAAAVNHLDRTLDGLSAMRVLVVGCGTMGSLAARRLAERGTGDLLLSNRTWQRAVALATPLGARPVPWQWRAKILPQCDALITAAAGCSVITAREIGAAVTTGRLRVVVDLGMPRNIEVAGLGPRGLEVVDLAGLADRLYAERAARSVAVQAAEAIVDEELATWWGWTVRRGSRRTHSENGVAAG